MRRALGCLVAVACVSCAGVDKPAPEPQPTTTNEAPIAGELAQPDSIRITAPVVDALVRSPLTVTGEARGGWFFEGSFPVTLLDASDKPIVRGYAQAQGEWMTEQMVPFKAELVFVSPSATNGTLVLEKANPSAEARNHEEARVPVLLVPRP